MVYQNLGADVTLEGDAVESVRLLTKAVRAGRIDAAAVADRRGRLAAAHEKLVEGYRAAEAAARAKRPIDPVWLCAALADTLPKDAIFVEETTTHRGVVQKHIRWNEPGRYYKVPSGLGQGLGVALGVKLANPKRPVVSLIGDGAFLYNPVPQSLGLAMEANLPILIVVFNNVGYQAMKNNQLEYYPDGTGKQHGIYPGFPIKGPDYAELAKPFGGWGRKVEDPAELPGAIRDGLAAVESGKVAILNVVISR
jgi:acetolactate synthase-1/2/3 large subunit